jgi:hypothetical protein
MEEEIKEWKHLSFSFRQAHGRKSASTATQG